MITEEKKEELLSKVKTKCHRKTITIEDDIIKGKIEDFYSMYESCSRVDDITILMVCNDCQSEEESDNNFNGSQITEVAFWDIKVKSKDYDGVPFQFTKSQYGIEAFNLIEQCKNEKMINMSVRL